MCSPSLEDGVPLAVVGAMLGHKHDRTTQRYANLVNEVVRDGLEAATNRIVGATQGGSRRSWRRRAAPAEARARTCGGRGSPTTC